MLSVLACIKLDVHQVLTGRLFRRCDFEIAHCSLLVCGGFVCLQCFCAAFARANDLVSQRRAQAIDASQVSGAQCVLRARGL